MQKYNIFCRCLDNLNETYLYKEPYANVILIGIVRTYTLCFEEACKAMQEILLNSGCQCRDGSPKQILKTAFAAGMITDEEIWLAALSDRNNASHAYNSVVAMDIVNHAKEKYYDMFQKLKVEIEKNWL